MNAGGDLHNSICGGRTAPIFHAGYDPEPPLSRVSGSLVVSSAKPLLNREAANSKPLLNREAANFKALLNREADNSKALLNREATQRDVNMYVPRFTPGFFQPHPITV